MTDLVLDDVCHSWSRHVALDHVSLRIDSGVCGLIGENGAGKSTLLSIIAGALTPTHGRVTISGMDMTARSSRRNALSHVALMPQSAGTPPNLTTIEVVTYLTWMRGVPWRRAEDRARDALAVVDLEKVATTRCAALSGGMRRRVWLAQALAAEADVLLLDEPSTGLDPRQREHMMTALRAVADSGATIVLSSHVLDDVGELADHLIVLSHGVVVHDGQVPDPLTPTWFLRCIGEDPT